MVETAFLTTSTIAEPTTASLDLLLLSDRNDIDRDGIETKALEQILRLAVDVQLAAFGVLGEVESGHLGDVLILPLTLLFLQLEGDTTDRTALDTFHQMGRVTSNLVPQSLGGDQRDLIADPLVDLEVEGELWVISLDDYLGTLLHGLGTNATHFCGC